MSGQTGPSRHIVVSLSPRTGEASGRGSVDNGNTGMGVIPGNANAGISSWNFDRSDW